jgi:hypothetical protein
LNILHKLETIKEQRDFTNFEAKNWLETKYQLDDIYLEEEKYWHVKSRDQWLKYGYYNTLIFTKLHLIEKRKS